MQAHGTLSRSNVEGGYQIQPQAGDREGLIL